MAVEFPPITAGQLIAGGGCWPSCLLATSDVDECDCPCNGQFHGELAGVKIRGYEGGRMRFMQWWNDCGYSEEQLLSATHSRIGNLVFWKPGAHRWSGTLDLYNPFSTGRSYLTKDEQGALSQLGFCLLRQGRATLFSVCRDLIQLSNARSQYDVRAFLHIAAEMFEGQDRRLREALELFGES